MTPIASPTFPETIRQTAILAALLLGLGGCATVPTIPHSAGQAEASAKPEIIGPRGPLSAAQSKALIDKLIVGPGDDAVLQRHLAIEQALTDSPLIAGNMTHVLRDGPASFAAMFAAIRRARNYVDLEYFILEDVESGGQSLSDLLIAEKNAGVAVNVIYDSYGSSSTPNAFFDRLKAAGINLVSFNPVDPLEAKTTYSLNDRDHRKILVVDGVTGIVGGVNLSTDYQSNPLGKSGAPSGAPQDQSIESQAMEHWRDTDLEIDGPAVAELHALFLDHWTAQKGPPITDVVPPPEAAPPKGGSVVRVLGSTPDDPTPEYYATLLSAIRNAEKTISIDAAYFVPTDQEMQDLTAAARRGIDVRLLLPDASNSDLSIAVAHSHYTDLIEAGVKIYETHGLVLHSKTVTIDGVWSVIGSSNFDHRSVIFNDEVDAVVLGSATAQELEAMFAEDQAAAKAIDLEQWKNRSLVVRAKESFAILWQNLL